MVRRIAIIPARGGSKRIPNKNIREFCGKPIIAYTLNTAKESGLFDLIHVSTDSEEICKVVKDLGFSVDFLRPDYLADDHVPIMPVLKYVLEKYLSMNQDFDEVYCLMACAPLIQVKNLHLASSIFKEFNGERSVLAISEYPTPIEWAFRKGKDELLYPLQPGMFEVRSQDLEKKYFDTGAFSIFSSFAVLSSKKAGSDNNFIGCIIPKGSSIDLDEEEDWVLAETIYKGQFR